MYVGIINYKDSNIFLFIYFTFISNKVYPNILISKYKDAIKIYDNEFQNTIDLYKVYTKYIN